MGTDRSHTSSSHQIAGATKEAGAAVNPPSPTGPLHHANPEAVSPSEPSVASSVSANYGIQTVGVAKGAGAVTNPPPPSVADEPHHRPSTDNGRTETGAKAVPRPALATLSSANQERDTRGLSSATTKRSHALTRNAAGDD